MSPSRSSQSEIASDPGRQRREAWGDAIRERRKLCGGITQKELASRLGITISAVSAWENGDTSPRDDMKIRVADVLRTTPSKLFLWGDEA